MYKWFFILVLFLLFGGRDADAAQAGMADTPDTFDAVYESIPLDEVEDVLKDLREDDIDFSLKQYVRDAAEGKTELSLTGLKDEVGKHMLQALERNRKSLLRLVLCGVLSGIFLNFSTNLYEKQMGQTGFYMIYFLAVTIMAAGFSEAASVASDVLGKVMDFMKVLIPSFSVALTWSAGSVTSMAFYQAALSAIALSENVLIKVFLPLIQVYFLVSVMNPLLDWKFARLASLIRGVIRFGTKTLLAVMIGHQGIQGLITPAVDGVKRSTLFQAANGIPGVGNVFGGVADTVIGTGVLIKSAIGVGGLLAISILCLIPLVRLGVFTAVYKVLAAFTQPVTDQRIVSVFQGTAESGRLLAYIVFMTAVMFLITLTIVIAATNRIH